MLTKKFSQLNWAIASIAILGTLGASTPINSTPATNLVAQQQPNWKIAIEPQFHDAGPFSQGLARVGIGQPRDPGYGYKNIDKYGYIDKTGKLVIPFQFPRAGDFSEGLAAVVVDSNGDGSTDGYGYIDKTGKTVIQPQFDDAGNFSEGLAPVKINTKWGYINKQGKVIISPQFDDADRFAEGLAVVGKNTRNSDNPYGSKYGYIDKKGKLAIPLKFSTAKSFSEGLAAAESTSGKTKGYINKKGKFVIRNERLDTYSVGGFSSGLAVVELNGGACSAANYCGYSYISKAGKAVIQSPEDREDRSDYTGAQTFSEGLAAVATGGGGRDAGGWYPADNWGYINKSGKFVIAPQFSDAGSFSEGLAPVEIGGKYGYIGLLRN
ncbi:MAG: WG repeat-containing protein [Cyanosarcina radialis HA8281-LM2]|jgi:hypothetical protein|nr:WG repeat-containing protein [Cyanosarcina radialis HA8281-LM2]